METKKVAIIGGGAAGFFAANDGDDGRIFQSIQAPSSTHPGISYPVRANPSLRYIYEIMISNLHTMVPKWRPYPSSEATGTIILHDTLVQIQFKVFQLPRNDGRRQDMV